MAMVLWLTITKDDYNEPSWLMNRCRFRQSTDSRDKIYALMGLSEADQLPTGERCDYDMPAEEAFCGLTFDLMQHYHQTLLPLVMDPRLEPDKATTNTPRWALDVSHVSDYTTDWYHLYGWYYYNASGDNELDIECLKEEFLQDKTQLSLEGVLVDTIEMVGERFLHSRHHENDWDEETIRHIKSWERLAQEYVKKGTGKSEELYPGEVSLHEAFGRLLLGGLVRDEEQWPTDEAEATQDEVETVYEFLETGERLDTFPTIWGMIRNQTFFITEEGFIGPGHMDTQPGDQVWI